MSNTANQEKSIKRAKTMKCDAIKRNESLGGDIQICFFMMYFAIKNYI